MTDDAYEPFVASIIKTLEKNGYPDKKVALPLERMYAVAYEKGLNFNKALTKLEAAGIGHEKTNDKIIFSPVTSPDAAAAQMPSFDPAAVAELMKNMTPEQLQQIQQLASNLTPEERAEMLAKAKNLGFF